jgi:hypothetical protein
MMYPVFKNHFLLYIINLKEVLIKFRLKMKIMLYFCSDFEAGLKRTSALFQN